LTDDMINKIYNEHCMDTMKRMSDNYVDLTVTSPPYDDIRIFDNNIPFDKYEYKPIIRELYRVTKDGGVVVWVIGDQMRNCSESCMSFKQALAFRRAGFNLHDTMIFAKPPPGPVGTPRGAYLQAYQYMFVFVKGSLKTFNLIKDRKNKTRRTRTTTVVRKPNGDKRIKEQPPTKPFGVRTNIWYYAVGGGKSASDDFAYEHPAIFPEAMATDHIISWTNEGDVVYDPFCGSGTTPKMAWKNNRKYIGSEVSKKYYDLILRRMKKCASSQRLTDFGKLTAY